MRATDGRSEDTLLGLKTCVGLMNYKAWSLGPPKILYVG